MRGCWFHGCYDEVPIVWSWAWWGCIDHSRIICSLILKIEKYMQKLQWIVEFWAPRNITQTQTWTNYTCVSAHDYTFHSLHPSWLTSARQVAAASRPRFSKTWWYFSSASKLGASCGVLAISQSPLNLQVTAKNKIVGNAYKPERQNNCT